MDNEKRIKELKEKDYQKYFGVTKATFDKMLKILETEYTYKHIGDCKMQSQDSKRK